MERCGVAEVAAAHGLPFVAVRVIVDTAADALPRAVRATSRTGRVSLRRLVGGIAWRDGSRGVDPSGAADRAATRSLAAVAQRPRRMRALVTGATGFRRRRGARHWARPAWQVRALVRGGSETAAICSACVDGCGGRSRPTWRRSNGRSMAARHCFTGGGYRLARRHPQIAVSHQVDGTRNICMRREGAELRESSTRAASRPSEFLPTVRREMSALPWL